MTLYEIEESIRDIFDMIEENEGQYDDEMLLNVWESVDEELKVKVDGWCRIIKGLKNEEDKISAEVKRLNARKKSVENQQISMRSTLCKVLTDLEIKTLRTSFYTIGSFKPNGKLVYDRKLIGDEYKIEKISKDISEKAIREALESGIAVEGAKLVGSCTIR